MPIQIVRVSFRSLTMLLAFAALLGSTSCSTVELTSVVDTQFLLTTRDIPLNSMMVVYDTKDLALKQRFEAEFAEYLRDNTSAQVYLDIELYSPLKNMPEQEKVWAIRDNSIAAVLYVSGGGSGRPLRDWLLPESPDIDTETQAWKSSAARLFLPATGQVIWAGNIEGGINYVGVELISGSFYSAITSDLIRRGILAVPRVENPAMRGFNR
ncbi:MAG: hypothetical protein KFF77_11650 [Bacteroidetes bacterium]|nr:hypothetical protein [Bacteroidota bacterium]